MASVFFRGPKTSPRWYARIKSSSGAWISRRVRQETRREAMAVARALEAKAERQRLGLEAPDSARQLCADVARRWEAQLTNRAAADDRSRLRLHVLPRWGARRLDEITTSALLTWLADEQAARPRRVSPQTLKHCLGIVSRIFSWAVGIGLAAGNPVRAIPAGCRPEAPPRRAVPWISDDAVVRKVMAALPEEVALMFFLGNRAGLRLGEVCGLRLSDLDGIDAGAIRVRYSYDGPLKEDRRCAGKVKWAPAPVDARAVLASWLDRRRAAGAGPEDKVFADGWGRCRRKEYIQYRWARVAETLDLNCSWYQATRHSFASRNLSRGVALDQVAAAMGHATPATTARSYAHFVRKTFDGRMTAGIGDGEPAKVIPIEGARQPVSPAAAPRVNDATATLPVGTATEEVA